MAAVALATLLYALFTQDVRRGHDEDIPRFQAVTVPFIIRFSLGAYIIALVYLAVRTWSRRGQAAAVEPQTLAGSLSVPAVALVGLILVVLVILTTPKTEPPPDDPLQPKLVAAVPPAELEALAYLPADTDIVVGLHVAEAMQTVAGKQAVDLLSAATVTQGLGDAKSWTGLDPEDLDHLVIGFQADKGLSQGTLVVQTRRPYKLATIRQAFPAGPASEFGKKPVYSLPWKEPARGLLWCADARTLVVVFNAKGEPDLKTVPTRPRNRAHRLPPPIEKLFEDRPLGSGHPVWLVGRFPQPGPLRRLLAVLPGGLADAKTMARVRSVRAGIRFDRGIALNAHLEGKDPHGAAELKRLFEAENRGRLLLTVRHKRGDRWVSVQANLKSAPLAKVLGKP
jgi:hypothetical protein